MKGIDVSEWNGVIDWKLVPKDIEFVYVKSGTGVGSDDKKLKQNHEGSRFVGKKTSLYHFSTMNNIVNPVADAKSEAQWFLSNIRKYKCDLPPALDLEDSKSYDKEVTAIKAKGMADKKEEAAEIKALTDKYRGSIEIFVDAFQDEFDRAGQELILYSYAPYLDMFLPKGTDMKLWIAAYTRTLTLPKSYTEYYIWQYSAKGQVAGIPTNVDMNVSKLPLF